MFSIRSNYFAIPLNTLSNININVLNKIKLFCCSFKYSYFLWTSMWDIQSFCADPGFDSTSPSVSSGANLRKLWLSPWKFNSRKWEKQPICFSLTDFKQRTSNVTNTNIAKKYIITLANTKLKKVSIWKWWRHPCIWWKLHFKHW